MKKHKIVRIIQLIILLPVLIVCPKLGQNIWKTNKKKREHWKKTTEDF